MRKKGFTLIELLVVSAILLILLEAGYSFFINNYRVLQEEKKKAYIESQVKSFMDYVMQSLQMAYQEDIVVKKHDIHTDKDELVIYLPKENSEINLAQDKSNAYKIEIYSLEDEIYITKTNGVSLNKKILDDNIEDFRIETQTERINIQKPDGTFEEKDVLKYIEIKFTVDYKIRDIKRDYSIKYNIRR
ncbi:type II secretion system protein [Caloramator sp. ALD01]|uniref:type II secretion system protein n=1 Tax=Caloramator sp. ALD01 TaxID=1031288 RepID=UPI00040D11A7|nr:type II secretion system protein [Caloramator sp. ALD01]